MPKNLGYSKCILKHIIQLNWTSPFYILPRYLIKLTRLFHEEIFNEKSSVYNHDYLLKITNILQQSPLIQYH